MAYCNKCGAYIPDGLSACLACGYDENAQTKENTATASAKSKNDAVRQRLEEQRKARQEENRRWAEQEEARRQQQEQSRQWAAEKEQERRQQQEQRRQAEREEAARNYTYRSTLNRVDSKKGADSSKLFGALSYLSFLFVLPYIFCPQDDFARFHAKQGLKLFIFTLLSDTIGALTGFGWILTLLRFYFIYKGMTNAFNGVREPLPYIGNIGS